MASNSRHYSETNDGRHSPVHHGTQQRTPAYDSDDTPRSEAPAIISTLPTPRPHESRIEDGYFALKPLSRPSSAKGSPTPSIASSTSSLKLRDAVLEVTRRFSQHFDPANRPSVQRDFSQDSVDSTDSTATVIPGRRIPKYPNQAFSALHQQQYPRPHLPPGRRFRSFHPAESVSFTSSTTSLHHPLLRTATTGPETTPGLFNPSPTESPTTPTSEGAYPSPYLHYLHTQVPKETHVADIDVDPVSGRKIINGYEIIDELGRGTHGKVKLGRSLTTNGYVAIKIVERYSKKRRLGRLGNAEDKVKKEVAILKKARHPNIVALLEVIDDPSRKKVYIILERVEMGEIQWRTEGEREIAMVEYRRYDRESQGIFDDPYADQEDQAMIDLGRVRRAKAARSRWKRVRRARASGHSTKLNMWSIELAGDSDDDSDMDLSSRISASTEELHAGDLARRSRAHTPIPSEQHHTHHEPLAQAHPSTQSLDAAAIDANAFNDRLEGTMYGGYDEITDVDQQEHDDPSQADINALTRNLSHDNLLERAIALTDADIHPDLLKVPCLSFSSARSAFRDTLLGLQYLHYQGIIHRDIKPPNLLQTRDRRTKISDFGVSYLGRPAEDEQAENLSESDAVDFDEAKELAKTVGTAAFYAPELCYTDASMEQPHVGKAIDVWALGITLFCMLFGRVPFVDSEYVVMRRIAEDEIYIPRKRLKPVDGRPKSRPDSHGRHYTRVPGFRNPVDIEYEELDDRLISLLHRLLIKDPKERITLEEIRHHPWVLADIVDKPTWLNETDPNRQALGQKIEVSREDIEKSVVPITIMERIRSGIKKAVGSALGRSASAKRRDPSHSGSTTSVGSSGSAATDGRRNSLHGDEAIFSALKASREGEHPLAQSVTASPEMPHAKPFFAHTTSLGTPRIDLDVTTPARESHHDRHMSTMSTTGSSRTVRPSDVGMESWQEPMSPSSSTLSSSLEAQGPTSLLHGPGKFMLATRERSAVGDKNTRDRSNSRASSTAEDAHADPSLAISTASAAGMLDPPQALKEISSPSSSKPSSSTISRRISSKPPAVEQSKGHSHDMISPPRSEPSPSFLVPDHGIGQITPVISRPESRTQNESADERFARADNDLLRRHVAESLQRQHPNVASHRDKEPCPPSPDDEIYQSRAARAAVTSTNSVATSAAPSLGMSPASPSPSMAVITPSTSEDRFASSHRSISSVMSHQSPSEPFHAHYTSKDDDDDDDEDDDDADEEPLTLGERVGMSIPPRRIVRFPEDDDGYHPDNEASYLDADRAVESDGDEYDDSSDEDGGLTMSRRRSAAQGAGRSMSISNAVLARYRERRETGSSTRSKKSLRSESSNTMKKVRTRSYGEGTTEGIAEDADKGEDSKND